jgi:hypothetical protein
MVAAIFEGDAPRAFRTAIDPIGAIVDTGVLCIMTVCGRRFDSFGQDLSLYLGCLAARHENERGE